MKPGIERLDDDCIEFQDGSSEPVDVLVYATGYQVTLPFLARPRCSTVPTTGCRCICASCPPDRPGLFFIGFIQTIGANIPLYEYQAEWVGDLITGTAALPDREHMQA